MSNLSAQLYSLFLEGSNLNIDLPISCTIDKCTKHDYVSLFISCFELLREYSTNFKPSFLFADCELLILCSSFEELCCITLFVFISHYASHQICRIRMRTCDPIGPRKSPHRSQRCNLRALRSPTESPIYGSDLGPSTPFDCYPSSFDIDCHLFQDQHFSSCFS